MSVKQMKGHRVPSSRRSAKTMSTAEIMPELVRHMGMRKEFKRHMVFFYWPKIVGRDIAQQVHPVRMEFATLFLHASSSVWANQIMMMQLDIIQKVNAFAGEELVKKLRFSTAGDKEQEGNLPEYQQADLAKALARISLDDNDIKAVQADCAAIADEKVRAALVRFACHQKKLEKLKAEHGWHACSGCGVLCPPAEKYCRACGRMVRQQKEAAVRKFLQDIPWARFAEVNKEIADVTPAMVNKQRVRLLQRLMKQVKQGDTKSVEAKAVVMLYRSVPPEQLTDDLMRRTIYKLRFDLIRDGKFKPHRRYDAIGFKRGQSGKK
jgi:hypothetical protein